MAVTDIERGLVARYLARVLERGDLPLRATRHILYWLNDRADMLNLPLPKQLSKAIGNIYSGGFAPAEFERALLQSRDAMIRDLKYAAEETPRPEPLATNIERLVAELGMPVVAWKIVGLVACYTRYEQVQYLCDCITETAGPMSRVVALLVDETPRSIEGLISPTGELMASGLLQLGDGDEIAGPAGRFAIPFRVNACLDSTFDGFADMRRALLGSPLTPALALSDFDHIEADRDLVANVLKGAGAQGARGVNILLYGPPGTGKTELTKAAAEFAGLSLYGAGEEVSRDGEADRSARLADLVFSLRLLAGSEKTALLFDEMEDVAWQLMRRGGSKVYLNRLLETNPVPILWTSNNIHEIDAALLRRMTLAIEMKLPPASQRRRILERLAARVGMVLSEEETDALSRRVDATPAVLENALRAAKLSGGGAEAVERAAIGIVRAVSGQTAKRPAPFPDFDPKLIAASNDLVELGDKLAAGGRLGFSLCLSGPPGTGKSAYARYLARKLGLEVVQKRASDLLGMYVGESEKRIAAAFEEARESNSFLIFDEADSFLLDRKDAVRSWEVTQVNEMLTWMEDHPLPVCFTTNLMDRMDEASLRRFTFHVRFNYLEREALLRAYRVFFGLANVAPAGLALANLTPGDFAQAKKQVEVLGVAGNAGKIIEMMEAISRGKRGATGPIGFVN